MSVAWTKWRARMSSALTAVSCSGRSALVSAAYRPARGR